MRTGHAMEPNGFRERVAATLAARLRGGSRVMCELREQIVRIAPLRLAVLIEGPSGSGKELVAHGLHLASGRAGAYVPFNVCAIPETMFEDAMFGHVRGAFTGAHADVPGYLLQAHAGTAFLDEIGGLALALQPKLLRAVDTGGFRPVGARADRQSEFRLVSATNRPLDELVDERRFRLDLAQRLRGIVLRVPALTERRDDIPELVQHFAGAAHADVRFALSAMRALVDHDWPGNVRELRHTVECLAALHAGEVVGAREVDAVVHRTRTVEMATPRTSGGSSLDATSFAASHLLELMERVRWDVSAACRELGVHRATLYRRLRRYGIAVAEREASEYLSAARSADAADRPPLSLDETVA